MFVKSLKIQFFGWLRQEICLFACAEQLIVAKYSFQTSSFNPTCF